MLELFCVLVMWDENINEIVKGVVNFFWIMVINFMNKIFLFGSYRLLVLECKILLIIVKFI